MVLRTLISRHLVLMQDPKFWNATLAIIWPQSVLGDEDRLAVAVQVHGGVS